MSERARKILGGLLVAVTMSRPLGAQRPLVIEAGVSSVRFIDDDASAFGPSVRVDALATRGRMFAAVDAGGIATFGAASGFGSLVGGVRGTPSRGWITELSGELFTVAGSGNSGGAGTALATGSALWSDGILGTWVRSTGSGSARTNTTLSGLGVDAGAWWTWPRGRLAASLAQQWTSAELYLARFRTGYAGTTPVRYTEGALSMRVEGDRTSLDASAGLRRDTDAAHLYEPAFNVVAAYWMSDTRAFVFSASHQLPDWVRGADAADAVSFGMRFRQATPAVEREARQIPVVQIVDANDGRVLRVRVAGARQVEVRGDFTDWEAQPLVRKGADFERPMRISPGTHRLLVRVDGGAWRPAANTPSVDDDLGGRAGLLVVP